MAGFLVGAAAVEDEVGDDDGRIGMPLVELAGRGRRHQGACQGRARHRRRLAGRHGAGEGVERGRQPGAGHGLEIDVAVGPLVDAGGAERREAVVEVLGRLAEALVARIAEAEDGEFRALQPRRLAAVDEFVEIHGIDRRLAVAVGTGDEEHMARLADFLRAEVTEVDAAHRQAADPRLLLRPLRQAGGMAGLRAVEDEQRRGGDAGRLHCRLFGVAAEGGQVAAEPQRLLGRQVGQQRFELAGMLRRQRHARRERSGRHGRAKRRRITGTAGRWGLAPRTGPRGGAA
jgi:hypothetical protein